MTKLLFSATAILSFTALAACEPATRNDSADIVLTGGYVYTADANRSVAQAIAVRDGRIVAVGSDSEMDAFIGPTTEHRRLNGKMVMPGLHDMHIHGLGTIAPEACDLDGQPVSLDTMVEIIQGCIEDFNIKEGDWVPVMQWNPYGGNQPSAAYPTLRSALDAASHKHPVFLIGSDGHHAAANSMALASLSPAITAETLTTTYKDIADLVVVDSEGNPTGGLNEGAMSLVGASAEKGLMAPARELMPKVAKLLASRGLTSIQDAMVGWEGLDYYRWLADEGDMTFRLRTALHYPMQNGHSPEDIARVPLMIEELVKMRTELEGREFIRADATKLFADGVMEGNPYGEPPTMPIAAVLKPYLQPLFKTDEATGAIDVAGYVDPESPTCQSVNKDPDTFEGALTQQKFKQDNGFLPQQCTRWSGILEHSENLIKSYIQQATDAGFHVHVHAIADKAVRIAADAFERAKPSADRQGLTQSLAHVQYAQDEDLVRLGKLGAFIAYTYYWILPDPDYDMTVIPFMDKVAGRNDLYNPAHDYMQHVFTVKTAMDAGVVPVFGSDAPVDSRDPRPFQNMAKAITRENQGLVLNAAERMDVHAAIASFTTSSAGMMARADELGSLEVGKLADLIIIDRNIVALAENGNAGEIGGTKVLTTIFNGKVVYKTK